MKKLKMSYFHCSAHLVIIADNPEGRPPPSSRQCQSMSDMESRASRYPDMLPKLERLKQQLILFDNELKGTKSSHGLHAVGGEELFACQFIFLIVHWNYQFMRALAWIASS